MTSMARILMEPNFSQRRRVAMALAVTAIVVPGYLLLGRTDPAETTVSATETSSPVVDQTNEVTIAPTGEGEADAMGTIPLGYLSGGQANVNDDIPTIVIPRPSDALVTTATFARHIGGIGDCLVPYAPRGQKVTILNTDNGHKLACKNTVSIVDFQDRTDLGEVVLHVDAFSSIANLTDAPVPVEVSW